jgi:hypothetical protein
VLLDTLLFFFAMLQPMLAVLPHLVRSAQTLRICPRVPTTPSSAPSYRNNSSLVLFSGTPSLVFLPHPRVSSILEATPARRPLETDLVYTYGIAYQRITEESPIQGNLLFGGIFGLTNFLH